MPVKEALKTGEQKSMQESVQKDETGIAKEFSREEITVEAVHGRVDAARFAAGPITVKASLLQEVEAEESAMLYQEDADLYAEKDRRQREFGEKIQKEEDEGNSQKGVGKQQRYATNATPAFFTQRETRKAGKNEKANIFAAYGQLQTTRSTK